ncbi:MAG: hypothetical protein ACI8ZM_002633 [Crocinitomix sp.]|jgi:hypothetical protein
MSQLKQHISIALLAIMLIGMLWQTFIVVHFYMNQEAIIEAHCVNKDKPDLNCKGQCHLKKQLKTAVPDQEDPKSTQSSKTSILMFVYAETNDVTTCQCPEHQKTQYPDGFNETRDYVSEVFNPPQFV